MMALSLSPSEIVANSNNQLLSVAPHWDRVRLSDVARVGRPQRARVDLKRVRDQATKLQRAS